ncbi:MAG: phenylalanine--tRNA ligase subunit alpha [Bacteroidales bacterium]|nr:phenylalanine--tRNA ligase subunit alpha [Bacteroidales bacterium]
MIEKIKAHIEDVKAFSTSKLEELEAFKNKFLSKKSGILNDFFKEFKNVPVEGKKEFGQVINNLKNSVEEKFAELKEKIEAQNEKKVELDLSLPGENINLGSQHPITVVRREMLDIFEKIGFVTIDSPEIDDDFHNFTALNFPPEHPARDMQDTFFVEKNPDVVLRTHTSNGQIRFMENHKPPFKVVIPGRTYRNEDISARSHFMFHQIEGLYVDENVSFIDLKQTLLYFAKEFFGPKTKVRFRPSYFPFTEPSAEMDVTCSICGGEGCNVCKYTGWLEILGSGMVDPNVLENVGIDSKKYSGYAFGMGIERIVMLKYGVKDIRYFFENDMRFLSQFENL